MTILSELTQDTWSLKNPYLLRRHSHSARPYFLCKAPSAGYLRQLAHFLANSQTPQAYMALAPETAVRHHSRQRNTPSRGIQYCQGKIECK